MRISGGSHSGLGYVTPELEMCRFKAAGIIMDDTNRRKQMIYRANHRGIKEMDIILGRFASARVMDMDLADLEKFHVIMEENDRDLLSWFTGEQPWPAHLDKSMFAEILEYTTSGTERSRS